MSGNDLGASSTGEESDFDGSQTTSFETPVRYKHLKNSRRRSRVHLQTSCSSEEDDDGPPRSRPRPEFQQPKTSGPTPRRTAAVTGGTVPLREATNKPTKSSRTSTHSEKENSQGGTQLSGIEKALLETNQLLKHVIRRVDKCGSRSSLLKINLMK